jgi:hypothetical protein
MPDSKKTLREAVEDGVDDVKDVGKDLKEIPTSEVEVEIVREPLVHQVGRQALGFAMAIVAEKLANVTYDQMLKIYRRRRH